MSEFYPETLPKKTADLIKALELGQFSFLADFYLSGGTALSLQLGHRESEDLDFFTAEPFQPIKLQQTLSPLGKLEQLELAEGTLNTFISGVKLQFLEYPYGLLEPLVQWDCLSLSSVADIACTKLQTVGMRGSKKDFIDLYFIFEKYSLNELFDLLKKKYPSVEYSQTHIIKSLVYFADADNQPMPRMHKEVTWEQVKATMIQVVRCFPMGDAQGDS